MEKWHNEEAAIQRQAHRRWMMAELDKSVCDVVWWSSEAKGAAITAMQHLRKAGKTPET